MAETPQSVEKEVRTCVVCGTRTEAWVRGWDGEYRCIDHAPGSLSEYLIEADQGHMELTHEPCGEQLLLTLRVHFDTVTRLVREHRCSPERRDGFEG